MVDNVRGRGTINENDMFIFPTGVDINADDLKGMVEYNKDTLNKSYDENIKMYKGHYPILDQEDKPLNKPDNRIVINFAKYIVDIFNGFFIGIPPQITLDDEAYNDNLQGFNNMNSFVDKLSEVSKQTSIYGRSYMFLYQNEDSETRIAVSSPTKSFMIYDDTVACEPLYFVRYAFDDNNAVSGDIYTENEIISFGNGYKFGDTVSHLFGSVPAVEFVENEERQGAFDSVKSIMNSINSALSQKANDVEAIADAYFFMSGADLSDDDLTGLADNRVLSVDAPDAKASFLERPNGDGTQENLIDRLEEKLFLTAMVTNLNDLSSGASSAASGYSIELRMQAMRGLAANKERKYTSSIRELFKIVFDMTGLAKPKPLKKVVNSILGKQSTNPANDLKFQFTRNLPKNVADEANTASTLEGIVSKETQLSVLSIVDDPKKELDRMANEEADSIDRAVNTNPANHDFEKEKDNQQSETGDVDEKEQ
ncbi:phage portal protein [Weissella oryzae SG25]|uniref:Phage portal protein n=1 Tax=Weissella oryzae (strain DSM 25784 / JCM 18191 / LMG 30913 / SG25) TaxID=1329250 RepID=A0A069CU31_WEIOS|nr:phage portal protein [Weissella oryzae]GAK31014.1 phage portal protein [Weissella oryzae SG25]